jgi:polar amino acid transport system substrate-binding protein
MNSCLRAYAFMLCLLLAVPACAARHDQLVRLATLEWPPYNSAALPGGGLNTALVRRAFADAGYRLEVVQMPWVRAVDKGKNDPSFDGYFPEYLSPVVRHDCFLSARAGESPVGLVRRGDTSFYASNASELLRYRVGVVEGYNNTEQFDANVEKGLQQVDQAQTDGQNLIKLWSRRVDLAIVDRNVMRWLLAHDPRLQSHAGYFQFLEPPLQVQGLYICFKRNRHGQQLADAFSGGLLHINQEQFTRDYMNSLLGH